MSKPGTFARRKARQQRWSFLRAHRRTVALFSIGYAAIAIIVVLSAGWRETLLRPYVIGASVIGYGWFVSWYVTVADGTFHQRMGAMAEEWTAQSFSKLRPAGWYVINSVPFEKFDVDHVVVGPAGVLAVETKWTSVPWRITGRRLVAFGDPIRQAERGATQIERFLESEDVKVPVVAVVVVWGAGTKQLPEDSKILGRTVLLSGKHARRWRAELDADHLDVGTIEAVREVLQRFIEQRAGYEARSSRSVGSG